jgi:hypothetical protein
MENSTTFNGTQPGGPINASDEHTHKQNVLRAKILAIVIITVVSLFMTAVYCFNRQRTRTKTEARQDQILEEGLDTHTNNQSLARNAYRYPGIPISLLHLQGLNRQEHDHIDSGVDPAARAARHATAVEGNSETGHVCQAVVPPGIPISALGEEEIKEGELQRMEPSAVRAYRARRKIIETVGL